MAGPPLVLVDARIVRRRSTGVATYVTALRSAIEAAAPGDLRVEWLLGPPGLPRRGRWTSLGNLALDLAWLHAWVPLVARRRRARLVHAPVNWAPWRCPCPTVVTVHDLSWERVPDAYPSGFRRYARLFARHSARRARIVVADSAVTARDLGDLYGVDAGRVRVVPLGAPPTEAPAVAREPFVLAVGVRDPRKRIAALVAGHRRYWESALPDPPPCRLVLAGPPGGEEDAVLAAAGPGCEVLGFVTPERLADLYRRATLLAYPSAYEGFGLPVLEAMAHGCPVLVAPGAALEEVGGDAALPLPDASVEGIARRLAEVLADRPALAARGDAGRRRAAGFTWERTAALTLDAYREALAAEGGG
jgi:glycosyltransferase involved in cell wall biosynthesis